MFIKTIKIKKPTTALIGIIVLIFAVIAVTLTVIHKIGNHTVYQLKTESQRQSFLKEMGFECYMAAANVIAGRDEMFPPAHCVIVCILEGEKYLCDVGYGGTVPFGALSFSGESRFGFHLENDGSYIKLINEHFYTFLIR